MILLLAACSEPPLLDAVSEALGAEALQGGELPLRMSLALSGLVAETCTAGAVEGYSFASRSAAALGATVAAVEHDEEMQTWIFDEVGLDEARGTLAITTDGQQENLAVEWVSDSFLFTAGLEARACDPDASSVTIAGTGTWIGSGPSISLTLESDVPADGLAFAPTTSAIPVQGRLSASQRESDWAIALDDASTLADDPPAWPGVANGSDWESNVSIRWP